MGKAREQVNLASAVYGRSGAWRLHTPAFLKEITEMKVDGIGVMSKPIQIFADILGQVAQRALELNDPQLNALMCRLTLYEESDPYSKDFDKAGTEAAITAGLKDRAKQLKKEKA
jgi:hypothetical protein